MAPRLLCHDLLAAEVALCFRGSEGARLALAGGACSMSEGMPRSSGWGIQHDSMTDFRALRIEMERGASSGVGGR
jgi:hypothetical protein